MAKQNLTNFTDALDKVKAAEKHELPVDKIVSYDSFEDWWHRFGSGIGVIDGDDYESHAKKVASVAYQVGFLHGISYEQNANNS